MSATLAKCPCQHCGGGIEFDASDFTEDQAVACPHCGQETHLFIKRPPMIPKPTRWSRLACILKREARQAPENLAYWKNQFGKLPQIAKAGIALFLVIWAVSVLGDLKKGNIPETIVVHGMADLAVVGMLAAGLFVYFIPSLKAHRDKRKNWKAILVLNILLGWTFVGWVVAMVWAFLEEEKPSADNRPAKN